jgi:hypothetical protein
VEGQEYRVNYLPAESDTGMFGGNSNWRGPVWMPVNALLIRSLLSFYLYYGDSFKIECPTGSGNHMNLFEVAREISNRLTRIFLRDKSGRRPVYGGTEKFQSDPHWKDYILFYEYFHGDNGAGLGASHQTGWTGVVAKLIELFGRLDGAQLLDAGPVRRGHRGRVVSTPRNRWTTNIQDYLYCQSLEGILELCFCPPVHKETPRKGDSNVRPASQCFPNRFEHSA